jgi:TolB-like protein
VKASFFNELKKRRVYQSAVAYAVVAWGITEILEGVIAGLGWPDWLATLAVILFVMGFPVAMFLAWIYDWTPEGIKRTAPSGPLGWLPVAASIVFLVTGSAGLFWLINPSGVVRVEQVGVAVLPCRYRGDPELEFRGTGIAGVLNERLAQSQRLFVPAYASVLDMSGTMLDTAQLGTKLHVLWLIECRLAEVDSQISIDANIVDVATDESISLISQKIKVLDLVGALDIVETAIFNRLGIPGDQRPQSPVAAAYTPSIRAFDQFLKGQQAMRTGTSDGIAEARTLFRAAQSAGNFDRAHLHEAISMLASFELAPPESAATRNAALKAIGLILDEVGRKGTSLADLYTARLRLANLADQLGSADATDDAQRLEWLQRATALRPSFAEPYFHYAEYLARSGRTDEASEHLAKAQELAPGS